MGATIELSRLLSLLVVLCVTRIAAGQGTDGRLSDPIGGDDLERYAELLHLSREQVTAADGFLEEYRDAFKNLRDGEIERALTLNAREFAQRHTALLRRIASLDENFFLHIEPILSDDQNDLLPYVRLMRERERFEAIRNVRNLVGNGLPDLAVILAELSLSQDEQNSMRALMPAYQQRITSGLRAIFELSSRLWAAERGEEDLNDAARLIEQVRELRGYNRQTARALARLIADEDQAVRLHRLFFRGAFPQAYQAAGSAMLPNYDALLRSTDLDDADREAVLAMRRDAIARQTRLLEKAADIIDDVGIVFKSEEQSAMWEPFSEFRDEAQALRNSLAEAVKNRFGRLPDGAGFGYTFSQGLSWHPGGLMTRSTTLIRAQSRTARAEPPAPVDQFIAPAISSQDVARYAVILELDPADPQVQAPLETLHMSYLDSYSATIRPLLLDLRDRRSLAEERSSAIFASDELECPPDDLAPMIEEEFEVRGRCLRLIVQLDAGFFASIAEAFATDDEEGAERLERARFERAVRMYNRGQTEWAPMTPNGPNRAAFANILELVQRHVPEERSETLTPRLAAYRVDYLAMIRQRHQHMWERQKAAHLLFFSPDVDVEDYIRRQQAVRRAHHAISQLNQRTVEAIVEDVGWEHGWRFLDAFQREAYPEAFNDPTDAEPALTAALDLQDLRSHQRERLVALATEHRPAYASLREAIIRLSADFTPDLPGSLIYNEEDIGRAQQEFNKELERLKFERDNLNRAAMRQIRAALDEAQFQQIGAAK